MPPNPFTYEEPLAPDDLIDREPERALLVDLAEGGHNARLVGPRRFGKTTLLGAVGAEAARRGMVVVYVDCSRTTALEDVVVRLRRAWQRALGERTRRLERAWRQLERRVSASVTVGVPGLASLTATRAPPTASESGLFDALHLLLDAPLAVHEASKKRSLVVFDEFHDLLTARDDLDGVLRSHAQHQREAASYCFAGSQASAMRALFADRRRPLFEQARGVTLGPLDGVVLADWIEDRFAAHGRTVEPEAIAGMMAAVGGHPQRAMMVAHFLWAERRRDAAGLERALHAAIGEAADGLEQSWDSLTAVQRRSLSAAAEGHERLLAGAALERARVSKATMQSARKTLIADGNLLDVGGGAVRLADPFLGLWLAEGRVR